MTDVAQLGIRVDSAQALKAVTDLDRLAIAGAKAEAATDGISVASGRAAPAMGKLGGQSRMLAQQLSQVAQQSAATGNVMQAVAIQAADIGLAFGTIGAVVGTVATIALPALISALSNGQSQLQTFEDAIDGLKAAQEGLQATQDILKMSLPELYAEYGIYAAAVRDAAAALAELQVANAQAQLAETIYQSADALNQFAGAANTAFSSGTTAATAIVNIERQLGVTGAAAVELQGAFSDLKNAMSFEDRVASLSRIDALLKASGVSAAKLPPELRQALIEARQAEIAMAGLRKEANDAATAAASIADNAPGAGFLSGAIADAMALAGALWNAAAGSAAVRAGAVAGQGPAFERGGKNGSSSGVSLPEVKTLDSYFPSGGGGGGGGSDPYAGNLQSLIESLRTEREIEEEWYQESLTILQDRRAQEILGKAEHDRAMVALHEEYVRRIAEIDANSQSARLGYTADFFGAVASIAEAGGGRLAKVAAAAAAVEGTINAYRAALQAMADPTIPFWGKAAAYASVLAAGLKGVAAIRSAGGVGGGGGASVAAQGAAGGQVGPQATLNIAGLGRDRSYTGAELEQIFDGILGVAKTRGLNMPMVAFV